MREEVQVFGNKQQAVLKLPIYFGGYDNYHHPIRELVANARDVLKEMIKLNGKIEVFLSDDRRTVTVKDNGCGIPIEKITRATIDGVAVEKENWEFLFRTLFAGTKLVGDGETGGTNGCGNTVICYTSSYMDVISKRKDKIYTITFVDGGEVLNPFSSMDYTDDNKETGTEITVTLDEKIYTNTIFDVETVETILNNLAAVTQNTAIYFTHKNETKLFEYNSYIDYYEQNFSSDVVNPIDLKDKEHRSEYFDLYYKKDREEINKSNIIISCGESVKQECYLNGIYLLQTKESTLYSGVLEGLKTVFHKYALNNGMYENNKEKHISVSDIADTISFMAVLDSTNVSYVNQTKFTTSKEVYKEVVKTHVLDFMEVYGIENSKALKPLVDKVLLTKRVNEKAAINRKSVRKALEEKINNATSRPEKFIPCRSKNPKEVELILIEGDSAKNSIKTSRDSKYMCVYPLKGKPINTLKAKSIDIIMNNQEIKDIFKILGCGIEYKGKAVKGIPKFNIDNLLVDKILITTDQDHDGFHIQALLIALFYTLAPELLKQGKVYVLYTPLYIIKHDKKEYLAYSEEERNNIVKNFTKSFEEVRYKGLGGLKPKVLSETAMNPEKRILKQITFEDIEKCTKIIELFLTEEKSDDRKKYIEEYGDKYFDFSLLEG